MLNREFGLRFKEASLLDAGQAIKEANRLGRINITRGTKGGRGKGSDRWVPINDRNLNLLKKAIQHMRHLLNRKLAGNRRTRVQEHTKRAQLMAASIWTRFKVGPYQYQVKHMRWYLDTQTQYLKPASRYRYWLTTKNITWALNKETDWLELLQGPG